MQADGAKKSQRSSNLWTVHCRFSHWETEDTKAKIRNRAQIITDSLANSLGIDLYFIIANQRTWEKQRMMVEYKGQPSYIKHKSPNLIKTKFPVMEETVQKETEREVVN